MDAIIGKVSISRYDFKRSIYTQSDGKSSNPNSTHLRHLKHLERFQGGFEGDNKMKMIKFAFIFMLLSKGKVHDYL